MKSPKIMIMKLKITSIPFSYTSAANTVQVGLEHLYSQIMYVFLVLSKGISTLGNFTTRTPTSL